MITNKKLIHLDENLKKQLQTEIGENNFDYALRLIELSAHLQYNYAFNDSLYDKTLEDSLKLISDQLFKTETISANENTVLFYDFFGYDNRGLTQQYLRALKRLNKRIILVFENKSRHYKNEAILAEIEDYKDKNIYYLKGENRIEKCESLFKIVLEEKPKQVLLHLIPWDTIPYMVFHQIKGIERYQINLTDHTFWLGVDIIDINIEFRSYGLNLSEQLRNIPKHKNKILPYYPILSTTKFQGFDFDSNGKKIIFSGSTYYKVYGDNLEFFHTIHKLLKLDEDLIFLLAGSGNSDTITNFISENNLKEKIFLLGDRYDLYEVMKRVDYYISTFPFTGALMTQTAFATNIPIFAYVKADYLFNDLEDLFYKSINFKNISSVDELIISFSKHLKNDHVKNLKKESIINEEEFAENLEKIFDGENPMGYLEKRVRISDSHKKFNELMIESENLYNPQFENTVKIYLSHWESFKMIPKFRSKYYKKLLKENKLLFLKTIYYHLRKKL